MSEISSTVRVEFDSGHRIIGHEHKCKYLHGHRYILELSACAGKLDCLGRVADFGILKSVMKEWIDENFDHNVILNKEDREMGNILEKWTNQKIYYLPFNPTSENIILHLGEEIIPKIFAQIHFKITKLRLYETPNCFSEIHI